MVTQNIAGGSQYLAKMLELFDNDVTLALAAYNAGPGTVRRYGGMPPYPETERYVPLVLARADEYRLTDALVALKGETPKPAPSYLPELEPAPDAAPEAAVEATGALVYLTNGLTMRGMHARETERGVRLQLETGWILIPNRNVDRVEGQTS